MTAGDFKFAGTETELSSKWGWFVALGIVFLVLAGIAVGNLTMATLTSVLYIGILVAIGAVAQIIHAFQVKEWSGFFYWLTGGILYGVAGIMTLANPTLGAVVMTLLLILSVIVAGVLRVWFGTKLHGHHGWGWIATGGIITILAGCVLLSHWPGNTLWLLGFVLAFDLAFQGLAALGFGFALKSDQWEHTPHHKY